MASATAFGIGLACSIGSVVVNVKPHDANVVEAVVQLECVGLRVTSRVTCKPRVVELSVRWCKKARYTGGTLPELEVAWVNA